MKRKRSCSLKLLNLHTQSAIEIPDVTKSLQAANIFFKCVHSFYSVNAFPPPIWSPLPPHLAVLVRGDIQNRIVQWLVGSFCTGDVEVDLSLLSEVKEERHTR